MQYEDYFEIAPLGIHVEFKSVQHVVTSRRRTHRYSISSSARSRKRFADAST